MAAPVSIWARGGALLPIVKCKNGLCPANVILYLKLFYPEK